MLLWTSNFSILRLLLKGYLIIFSYLILTLSNSSFSCLEASSHEYLSWIKNTLILYLDAYLAVRDIWKSLVRRRSLMEEVKPSKYCQQRVKRSSNFKTLARTLQLPSQGRRRSRKDKNRRKTGPYCTITIMIQRLIHPYSHIYWRCSKMTAYWTSVSQMLPVVLEVFIAPCPIVDHFGVRADAYGLNIS